MVRNRSVFLNGLKTRLDQDIAGRRRADSAAPPRWSGAAPPEDDWEPASAEPHPGPEDDPFPDHRSSDPPERDDHAPPKARWAHSLASEEPDYPEPVPQWSESGMPERLREAIASVRRISSDRGLAEDEPPPEPVDPWQAPQDDPPAPVAEIADTGGPGLRATGFALASAAVLLVGFGVGALLAGWDLGLMQPPTETAASPPGGSVASRTEPAPAPAPQAPPPVEEVVRLQPAPMPPAARVESPSRVAAANGLPLPPPPKPAPSSTAARGEPGAANGMDRLIDAAVNALVEEGGARPPADRAPAAAGPRVYVHFAASAAGGPAIAQHLVRRLKAEGFAAEARAVDVPIASPSIRYFFPADRDSAEALSAMLKGQVPGGTAPPIVDFTDFEPKPRPGNLEVWVDS